MPSSTPKTSNLPKVPERGASNFGDTMAAALKQLSELKNSRTFFLARGSKHTCYKPGCGNSYEAETDDFCPKCGSNQEVFEKNMYEGLNF